MSDKYNTEELKETLSQETAQAEEKLVELKAQIAQLEQ